MSWKCKIDDILIFSVSGAIMAKPPDEKIYVEMPFIDQLKGMDWGHIEGDIDVLNGGQISTFDKLVSKKW